MCPFVLVCVCVWNTEQYHQLQTIKAIKEKKNLGHLAGLEHSSTILWFIWFVAVIRKSVLSEKIPSWSSSIFCIYHYWPLH